MIEVPQALFVSVIYLAIFALGEVIYRCYPSKQELSRKTVHFLGGIVALSFPYYIQSHWTLLVLSVSFLGILVVSKKLGLLTSVHGVKRVSRGAFYFPLAVYLIFLFSHNQPVLYFISILVMTIADTLAALLGGRYGRIKFDVEGNIKTLEGSTVFFFVTFLCIHIPLLLLTAIGRIESVLIAFVIALLVTGFEAISLSGSDNIFVPFGTYYILAKMTHHSLSIITEQVFILLFIIAVTILISWQPRLFNVSGLIGVALLNYAAWSLCNAYWFLVLLLAEVFYYILIRFLKQAGDREEAAHFQIKVVLYTAFIPTILLFIANTVKNHTLIYLPYVVSVTAQLAIISEFFVKNIMSVQDKGHSAIARLQRGFACVGSSVFAIAVLPVILYYGVADKLSALGIVTVAVLLAYVISFPARKYVRQMFGEQLIDHRVRLVSVGVAVVFSFFAQWLFLR